MARYTDTDTDTDTDITMTTSEQPNRTNIRTNERNEQCERFVPNSINNHKMQFSNICLSKSFENWDYLTACEGLRESK